MMDSKLKEMEEKLRCSQVADRTKAEVIRDIEAQHQEELGRQKHSSVLSSKQQVSIYYTHILYPIHICIHECTFYCNAYIHFLCLLSLLLYFEVINGLPGYILLLLSSSFHLPHLKSIYIYQCRQ